MENKKVQSEELLRVLSFVEEYHMFKRGDSIILGVSGGADSVCLLRMLMEIREEWNLKLFVVHIEHGIRKVEGKEDEAFVQTLCENLGVECITFPLNAMEKAQKWKVSLEEAGREIRYLVLELTRQTLGYDKLAMAHNMNDNGETILFHLARGTGLAGLAGIPPVREDIIRPLLCLERWEIEAYLERIGQEYCTDSTNRSLKYTRNKIRHKVVPLLEKINPQLGNHLFQTSQQLRDTTEFLDLHTEKAKRKYVKRGILINQLLEAPKAIQTSLIHKLITEEAIEKKNISSVHVKMVRDLFEKEVGKEVSLPHGLVAKKEYEGIKFYGGKSSGKKKEENQSLDKEYPLVPRGDFLRLFGTDIHVRSKIWEKTENLGEIPKKKYTKYLNYDKIKVGLVLRPRKRGDYFMIDKSGKRQKVQDYFVNEKVPEEERDHVWLLADGSHILWVIGYRISEAAKVTSKTKKILEIQVRFGGDGDGSRET